jgi:hypothetical protein
MTTSRGGALLAVIQKRAVELRRWLEDDPFDEDLWRAISACERLEKDLRQPDWRAGVDGAPEGGWLH